MGFFAVVREQDQPFEVELCHLNLWSLSGLFRRAFFWDVGLQLKADDDKQLSKLSLALPFSTESGGMKDLSDSLKSPEVSELIFGTSVSISGSEIKYVKEDGTFDLVLGQISENDSNREKKRSGTTFSYWNLILAEPIPPGQRRYIRVRFEVYNLGRTWIWKPFKSGAIIDLRVADLRETISLQPWNDLKSRIIPVTDLYLFVVTPSWLQHASSSPSLKYMRLLEGRVWENYLGRKTDFFRLEKMVIYYWRKGSAITPGNLLEANASGKELKTDTVSPFRAFLDLDKTNVISAAGSLVLTVLAVFFAALVAGIYGSHPKDLVAFSNTIKSNVRAHYIPLSAFSLMALVKQINDKYRFYSGVIPWVIKKTYRFEKVLYRIWR